MLIKKLLSLNFKGMQIAFFAGTSFGGIMGCLAGMGLGLTLGALFAPKSGRELRDDLAVKGMMLAETAKELGGGLADVAIEKGCQIKDKTTKMYSDLSDKVSKRVDDLKEAV